MVQPYHIVYQCIQRSGAVLCGPIAITQMLYWPPLVLWACMPRTSVPWELIHKSWTITCKTLCTHTTPSSNWHLVWTRSGACMGVVCQQRLRAKLDSFCLSCAVVKTKGFCRYSFVFFLRGSTPRSTAHPRPVHQGSSALLFWRRALENGLEIISPGPATLRP